MNNSLPSSGGRHLARMLNKPPFTYDPRTTTIKNAEGKSVMCMTGWNYLTKEQRMAPRQASKATDNFGDVVAHMLNRQSGSAKFLS